MTQAVDPAVSQRKFERAMDAYRAAETRNTDRGWWLIHAAFPLVEVAFITPNLRPRVVACAVRVDFTDHDVLPLSVRFIDALERRELFVHELLSQFPRLAQDGAAAIMPMPGQPVPVPVANLIQHSPDQRGFLCLPGVREYHANPAHTGDPWELHRDTGEGDMLTILETVWRYGAEPINQIGVGFQINIQQTGVPA